jgi:opacity protein-like surface antigen
MAPGVCTAAGVRAYDKDLYGDLNIRNKSDSGDMYIGIRGDVSFLTWKNEYKDESNARFGSESFNFKPVAGLDVFVGYKPAKKWRADLEFDYVGKYSETETEYYLVYPTEKTEFDLEVFSGTLNGYYDFENGLYLGIGAGAAITNAKIKSSVVTDKNVTDFSPMGALMFGWSYRLDDKVDFDLRYRFAVFHGGNLDLDTGGGTRVKTEIGFIKDNSFSVGIRYSC